MKLSETIEAILFYKGEGVHIRDLVKMLSVSEGEIREALAQLEESLKERGVRLMKNGDEVMLATAPEASNLIEALVKEELSRDLGKAGLETLSIVLYLGPVARSMVDYIRGVNSTFILRNLSIRGLVERVENPSDKRGFLYKPTFELLSHLGVSQVEELPEYEETRKELLAFEEVQKEEALNESQS